MPETNDALNLTHRVERPINTTQLNKYRNNKDDLYLAGLLRDTALVKLAASGLWEATAACRGVNLDFFQKTNPGSLEAKPIKALCNACPVKKECRVAAFLTSEEHGVWGGLFPLERIETPAGKRSLLYKKAIQKKKEGGTA